MNSSIVAAVGAPSITTAIAARLDFKSETVCVWNGMMPIMPTGSGDSLLDGQTFDPLVPGVMVDIGENTFSMNGSDELTIVMNIPADPGLAISASSVFPNEYQSRPAVLWRAIKIETGNPLDQPVWMFRRIRSGSMDKVEIQADGLSHRFTLTVESHSGRISNASGQTYLNQRWFDPADTSQDSAVAIANGDPGPAKNPSGRSDALNAALGYAPGT
jgi:hypothetical protein